MFISYIISPVNNWQYLKRCIESLNSQTNTNFEIIIADNSFGVAENYINMQLLENERIKILDSSIENDKLFEASKLVDESSKFVQLIKETTVVNPNAIEKLLSYAKPDTDLLIPGVAIKNGEKFIKNFDEKCEETDIPDTMDVFSYCFSSGIFKSVIRDWVVEQVNIEILIDSIICQNVKIEIVKKLCYYISDLDIQTQDISERDIEKLNFISNNICERDLNSLNLILFNKYCHNLMDIIDSESGNYESRYIAYDALKNFGKGSVNNRTLNHLFEINTGMSYSDCENLDLKGFLIYRKELNLRLTLNANQEIIDDIVNKSNHNINNRLLTIETKVSNYSTLINQVLDESIKKSSNNYNNSLEKVYDEVNLKLSELVSEIKRSTNDNNYVLSADNMIRTDNQSSHSQLDKIQEDIIELETNMHLLLKSFSNKSIETNQNFVSGLQEPVNEVPYLFATGKLGFKVLIRSFCSWIRFKFRRKKNK